MKAKAPLLGLALSLCSQFFHRWRHFQAGKKTLDGSALGNDGEGVAFTTFGNFDRSPKDVFDARSRRFGV